MKNQSFKVEGISFPKQLVVWLNGKETTAHLSVSRYRIRKNHPLRYIKLVADVETHEIHCFHLQQKMLRGRVYLDYTTQI